jgi:HK97 family phage major capsid protein
LKITELKEKREAVWKVQKDINDKAVSEKRDLTPEEQETWDKADAEFTSYTDQIKESEAAERRMAERENVMNERQEMLKRSPEPIKPTPVKDMEVEKKAVNPRATDEYREAFAAYLNTGGIERRTTLQVDKDTKGGFVIASEQFVNDVYVKLDNLLFVENFATKFKINSAHALTIPVLAADPADPDRKGEISSASEDTSMRFDKRQFVPKKYTKLIKISNDLLALASMDMGAFVTERLMFQFAEEREELFISLQGTGAGAPLSVFVASAAGISTSRDVNTGNTSTAITADGLINCLYSVKSQYRRNARWLFHRDGLKMIRKLKDGEGQYLWQSGIGQDRPASILGLPYDESEYCPSTFTTTLYVGILADWSQYYIVDARDVAVQVVDQLYAATDETGYFMRMAFDAAPMDEYAFARVKLG